MVKEERGFFFSLGASCSFFKFFIGISDAYFFFFFVFEFICFSSDLLRTVVNYVISFFQIFFLVSSCLLEMLDFNSSQTCLICYLFKENF